MSKIEGAASLVAMRNTDPHHHTTIAGLIAGGLALTLAVLLGIAIGATTEVQTLGVRDWFSFAGNIAGGGLGALGAWLAFRLGVSENKKREVQAKAEILAGCLGAKIGEHVELLRPAIESAIKAFDVQKPIEAPKVFLDSTLPKWPTDEKIEQKLSDELPKVYSCFKSLISNLNEVCTQAEIVKSEVGFYINSPPSTDAIREYGAFYFKLSLLAFSASFFLKAISEYEESEALAMEFSSLGRQGFDALAKLKLEQS